MGRVDLALMMELLLLLVLLLILISVSKEKFDNSHAVTNYPTDSMTDNDRDLHCICRFRINNLPCDRRDKRDDEEEEECDSWFNVQYERTSIAHI